MRLHRAPAAPAPPPYEVELGRVLRLAQEGFYWQGEVEDLLIAIRDGGDLGSSRAPAGRSSAATRRCGSSCGAIGDPALRDDLIALDEIFANHAMLLNCALDLLAVSWRSERLREEQGRLGGVGRQGERLAALTARLKRLAERRMSARWDRAAAAVAVVLGLLLVVGASARRPLDGGAAAPALPTWPLLFVVGVGLVVSTALGLAVLGPMMQARRRAVGSRRAARRPAGLSLSLLVPAAILALYATPGPTGGAPRSGPHRRPQPRRARGKAGEPGADHAAGGRRAHRRHRARASSAWRPSR